jgi:hypothetical protein
MGCGEPGLTRFALLDREVSARNGAFADAARGQELRLPVAVERLTRETVVERV